MQPHLDKALENEKVRIAWDGLHRSPGLLIVAGRYVPGMRFVVNASMGLSDIRLPPLPRLVGPERSPLVGLHVRARLLRGDHRSPAIPLASLVISSLITSAALAAGLLRQSSQEAEGREVPRRVP